MIHTIEILSYELIMYAMDLTPRVDYDLLIEISIHK